MLLFVRGNSHTRGDVWKLVWRVCNPAAPEAGSSRSVCTRTTGRRGRPASFEAFATRAVTLPAVNGAATVFPRRIANLFVAEEPMAFAARTQLQPPAQAQARHRRGKKREKKRKKEGGRRTQARSGGVSGQ